VPLGALGSVDVTTALRASLIRETAQSFAPDLVIVDKEPLGLRGELEATLHDLKRRGARLILGLRDVLDEPRALAAEWERKHVRPAVEDLYDDILVYGLREIHDPLAGLGFSAAVGDRTRFTGYLKRTRPASNPTVPVTDIQERILVTTGGGGDGETLIDWVISTYEVAGNRLPKALIVTGPFMAAETRSGFEQRIARVRELGCITFEPRMEQLVADARGVVCMGGYNTFCEILSFDKRAVLVPRQVPRCEQTIRARSADRLGLARFVPEGKPGTPMDLDLMARVIVGLEQQPYPSTHAPAGLLDGVENVVAHCKAVLGLSGVSL
jgi:predicted glycosyltransferase